MECNIEEIGGQIVESSNGKIVIRAPVKDEKKWQDWLQDFQLKSNSAWIVRSTFPSCSIATFRKGYVCQHSDLNQAVYSSKWSKNTVCKAKLSVRIKQVTANTRAKDKNVKVGMINTYFSWLSAPIRARLVQDNSPLIKCYVVLAQSRMQISGKVSLQLLVE